MRTMARFLLVTLLVLLPVAALAGDAGKGDNGFYIADGDFTLNTEFRVQTVGTWTDSDIDLSGDIWDALGMRETDIDPKTDFSVRRARIGFFGQAFYPWLKYRVTMDFGEGESDLKDAFIRMEFSDKNNWTFGQFKALFDWFELVDSKYQAFTTRPWGTLTYAPARDVGIMYSGHSEGNKVSWGLAIQNGNGANTSGNDNDDFLATFRIAVQNEGGFAPRVATYERPDHVNWIFGMAFLENPVGGLAEDDSGTPCSPGISKHCRYYTDDVKAWEVFGAVRAGRLDLNATWQSWTMEDQAVNARGNRTDYEFTYWNLDLGVFVAPSWQIVGRYGQWETDKAYDTVTWDGSTLSDEQVTEWRIGINHYFGSDNFKLQLDYGEVETETKDWISGLGRGTWTGTGSGVTLSLYFWI